MIRRFLGLAAAPVLALVATGCLANPTSVGPFVDPVTGVFTDDTDVNASDCLTTATGVYEVTVPGTVVDGLCLNGGSLVIAADNVKVINSQINAAPPTFFGAVSIEAGTGIQVLHSVIDCHGGEIDPNAGGTGVGSAPGTSALVSRNEIRNCADGINAASNHTYSWNFVHQPYNCNVAGVCDVHADGVQGSAEDVGVPLHDMVWEWNTFEYPGASSSFQFHSAFNPAEAWTNVVVRYNAFRGGAYAVRLPDAGNNISFYGNRLANYAGFGEFGLCTPVALNGTAPIAVWGTETGDPTDSLGRGIPDDANIAEADDSVIERADCE